MTDAFEKAITIICERRAALRAAEDSAIESLKLILSRVGEEGVGLISEDQPDDIYIPVAEDIPQEFEPISRIRYWDGKLEVFVQNFGQTKNGRVLLEGGRWIGYGDAVPDTAFILDVLEDKLEFAEGYCD